MPTWGLCQLLPGEHAESIHPDDLHFAMALPIFGHALQLTAESSEYFTLRYEGGDIRVKRKFVQPLPDGQFAYHELVHTVLPRSHIIGEIRRVLWHYKDSAFDYYLTVGAKPHTSRYRADELERLPVQDSQ